MNSAPYPASIPEHLELRFANGTPVIVRRWYTPTAWSLLFIGIFWSGLLVSTYLQMMTRSNTPVFALAFPLLHLGIGIFLIYLIASMFVNSTRIALLSAEIHIALGPLPWPNKNKQVAVSEFTDFLVRKRDYRRGGLCFRVVYVNRQNREQTLLDYLPAREEAEYICGYLKHAYLATPSAAL